MLHIAYQDFRYGEIYLASIGLCAVFNIGFSIANVYETSWNDILMNTFFLALDFIVVIFYFRIKERSNRKTVIGLIGNGDIILLFSFVFCFTFKTFVYYLIGSFTLAIIVGFLIFKNKPIPLVGILGLTSTAYHFILIYEFLK